MYSLTLCLFSTFLDEGIRQGGSFRHVLPNFGLSESDSLTQRDQSYLTVLKLQDDLITDLEI
jgi:hypothetical protein